MLERRPAPRVTRCPPPPSVPDERRASGSYHLWWGILHLPTFNAHTHITHARTRTPLPARTAHARTLRCAPARAAFALRASRCARRTLLLPLSPRTAPLPHTRAFLTRSRPRVCRISLKCRIYRRAFSADISNRRGRYGRGSCIPHSCYLHLFISPAASLCYRARARSAALYNNFLFATCAVSRRRQRQRVRYTLYWQRRRRTDADGGRRSRLRRAYAFARLLPCHHRRAAGLYSTNILTGARRRQYYWVYCAAMV